MHPAIALAWVALVLTATMAVVVLATSPGRPANRRLAAVFFLHAVAIAIWVLAPLLPPRAAVAAGTTSTWCLLVVPVLYLWLLSTLDAPLARALRSPAGKAALVILLVVFIGPLYVARDTFLTSATVPWFGGGQVTQTPRPLLLLLQGGVVLYALALAITIQAYRRAAPGTPAKSRAFWFMLAFGVHDLYFGYRLAVLIPNLAGGTAIPPGWVAPTIQYGRPLSLILWVLLLSYGMLRHQLFDLEVRIRQGAVRAALVALLVGVFFVASAILGQVVESRGGELVALGVVLVAALMVAPLHKAADRLLDRLLPGPTEAELDARRLQVFGAALAEVAAVDGAVPPRESRRLDALQRRLGIGARDREVLAKALAGRADSGLRAGRIVLGRYTLEQPIGGPGSRTWTARDGRGRRFVVKRSALLGDRREQASLQSLRHRNIVRLVETGDEPAGACVVLEHMDGGSLADRLVQGPMQRQAWNRLAEEVLTGLAALHARGIVHRDLKPANVLFDSAGVAAVADFDVARLHGLDETLGPSAPPIGTLRYMAPEQARGQPATKASDLYAAAATLYEALTGQAYLPPRLGETAPELRQRAATGRAFPETLPAAPELRDWFARALHVSPGHRFRTAADMRSALPAFV